MFSALVIFLFHLIKVFFSDYRIEEKLYHLPSCRVCNCFIASSYNIAYQVYYFVEIVLLFQSPNFILVSNKLNDSVLPRESTRNEKDGREERQKK